MKITRNQFLKLIPAAVLTLTGCSSKAQPANTESLVLSHHYQLDYAQQFTADCYEGGYTMLTIAESDKPCGQRPGEWPDLTCRLSYWQAQTSGG